MPGSRRGKGHRQATAADHLRHRIDRVTKREHRAPSSRKIVHLVVAFAVVAGFPFLGVAPAYAATWMLKASPPDQSTPLNSVHFPVDATTGYVVGPGGKIYKTTDGASSWVIQTSPVNNILNEVHFPVDATTGYAVGASGTILKTSDGGASWVNQTSPVSNILNGVHFPVDATTGYAVGAGGTILETTDGGGTWVTNASGTTNTLFSVTSPPLLATSYAVGAGGIVLKSGPSNHPPVAEDDADTVAEGSSVSVTVLGNDSDPDGDPLTITSVTVPANGTVVINDNGTPGDPTDDYIVYTHNGSETVSDTFTYTISDDTLTDTATVTITVTPANEVNAAPALDPVGDQHTEEQVLLTFTATASDPDVPADTLTFTLVAAPVGAVIDPASGVFTWTPSETQGPGVYSFDIVVTDDGVPNLADSETITVTVTVTEANAPPVAVDDLLLLDEDTSAVIDVTSNDSDPDGDSLTMVSVTQPSAGAVIVTGPGTVFYLPPVDFWGTTSFTYTVSDGARGEATATVFVEVASVNDTPIVLEDEYRLASYLTAYLNVLDNDWDPDGDPLRIVLGSLPATGHAQVSGNEIGYTPENGWVGIVTFSYFAVDASGARDETIVTVIISADVLAGAERLAQELGVATVPFEAPSPLFDTSESSLLTTQVIALLADAFFQTVEALRLPLSFLGLALLISRLVWASRP